MAEEVDQALPYRSPQEIALEQIAHDGVLPSSQPAFEPGGGMSTIGWLLALVGCIALLISFGMETTATADLQVIGGTVLGGNSVYNIGLMQKQLMVFQGGGLALLMGIMLICTGALIKAKP